MRLIDADALYEQTAKWEARALDYIELLNQTPLEEMDAHEKSEWRKWTTILNERTAFKNDVADAPTIDAVEVVRCKDCKHWGYDVIFQDGWCRGLHRGDPNWFCADGERREKDA